MKAALVPQDTNLLDLLSDPPTFPHRESTQERYERWRDANPHVIALFIRVARERRNRGERGNAKKIVEELRDGVYGEAFSINNLFTSRLWRDAERLDESLRGYFPAKKKELAA